VAKFLGTKMGKKSMVPVIAALAAFATTPTAAIAHGVSKAGGHVENQVQAQGQTRTVVGSSYVPTIWVDPDGCQHWVMDDGVEGYMTPNVTRDGKPVCNRGQACGIMDTDTLFATDKYRITKRGYDMLADFFNKSTATAYVIIGHTDSRASDAYNMRLSQNRANAVANVASKVGARVVDIRYFGERMPRATNKTAAGRQANRRVEIMCIR